MPDFKDDIGAALQAYVPDDDVQIDNGYTHIRFYVASSQTATATLQDSVELDAGQGDYEYVYSGAQETDWWEWCLYGDTPGEGPRSERMRIGPMVCTKKDIRQAAGRRLRIMRKVGTVLDSPSPTTTTFASTNLIDADASDHLYANNIVRFSSGNLAGESRRIRNVDGDGYDPATGTLTTNAFSQAPSSGDEFEIWMPKADDDTSEMMDTAIEWSVSRLYWHAVFYMTFDSSVEQYMLPQDCRPQFIQEVDVARGTYPNEPDWRTLSTWNAHQELRGPVIELAEDRFLTWGISQGDVIRIRYARSLDTIPSDSTRVYVPVVWAAAEAAMEFLEHLGTPSGGLEAVVDAERAQSSLQRTLVHQRRRNMPEARVIQEIPR